MELLANTMALDSSKVYTVGPLTDRETSLIPLNDYLATNQAIEGSIAISVTNHWGDQDPRIYRFDPGKFLGLLAALATGPAVTTPERQHEQLLFLGRAVLDFNRQAGGVIPARQLLEALASACKDKRIGERLSTIVQALSEERATYDLVRRDRLHDFNRLTGGHFFVPAKRSESNVVTLTLDGRVYRTRPDDLVWSCLRFFSGDNSDDWVEQARNRDGRRLGADILDYLETQVDLHALNRLSVLVTAGDGNSDVSLGAYRAASPVVVLLRHAPGVVVTASDSEHPGDVSCVISRGRIRDFQTWLAGTRSKLHERL
jgi:hypothetical protein